MISDLDLHWLAGLLEGEGCFTLHQGRYPEIKVNMMDRDVINRVAELFGGRPVYTIQQRGSWTGDCYSTTLRGLEGREMMRRLQPLLGDRRSDKINEVLANF